LLVALNRRCALKILVVGGGGREHALVWKVAQSSLVDEIFVAPGNAGTSHIATNLNIQQTDIPALVKTARQNRIDLTVVGPEGPLADGIVDQFQSSELRIFGPTRAAAEIESSKVFSKELMQKYEIPCARSIAFDDYQKAKDYVLGIGAPVVIKADGLAAGKGVIMAETGKQALDALYEIMEKKVFGSAGDRVIVEDWLTGKEMSFFVFSDGEAVLPTVSACDYKKAFDEDEGPNTGGMGSFSPPYFATAALEEKITETIMKPAIKAMCDEGRHYKGVLYGGLMIDGGNPKVLEFNARMGDPECQVIMPRLKSDLLEIMMAVTEDRLETVTPEWSGDACVGVVMASGGYPGKYETGYAINGLDNVDKDVVVFHAGTRQGRNRGDVITSGGRVLTVVATGKTLAKARARAYDNVSRISFKDAQYRKDIALVRE
jgi:phosphoribosylamine--glycine ligase